MATDPNIEAGLKGKAPAPITLPQGMSQALFNAGKNFDPSSLTAPMTSAQPMASAVGAGLHAAAALPPAPAPAAAAPSKSGGFFNYDPMDPAQNPYINGADLLVHGGVTPQFAASVSPTAAKSMGATAPAAAPAATPPATPPAINWINPPAAPTGENLPAGLHRSGIPGVYQGVGAHGEPYYTNIPGDYHTATDLQGGTPNPARGGLYRAAPSSLGNMTPNVIDGMDYNQLGENIGKLQGAMGTSGNAGNAWADQALLAQLRAKQADVMQGDTAGAYRMPGAGYGMGAGMMPGAMPGMAGGMTMGNLIAMERNRAMEQNNANKTDIERANSIGQEDARRQTQATADIGNFNKQMAEQGPQSAAEFAASKIPTFANVGEAIKWARTREGGNVLNNMALPSLRRSALDTQWGVEGINKGHFDPQDGGAFGWGNVNVDPQTGELTGVSAVPGGWNAAPVNPWFQAGKFNSDLRKKLAPLLPYLTKTGAEIGTDGG